MPNNAPAAGPKDQLLRPKDVESDAVEAGGGQPISEGQGNLAATPIQEIQMDPKALQQDAKSEETFLRAVTGRQGLSFLIAGLVGFRSQMKIFLSERAIAEGVDPDRNLQKNKCLYDLDNLLSFYLIYNCCSERATEDVLGAAGIPQPKSASATATKTEIAKRLQTLFDEQHIDGAREMYKQRVSRLVDLAVGCGLLYFSTDGRPNYKPLLTTDAFENLMDDCGSGYSTMLVDLME